MNVKEIFSSKGTIAEVYGFGALGVGGTVSIRLADTGMTAMRLRGHVSSHGQYYRKKFRTKVVDGVMHVLREA